MYSAITFLYFCYVNI